MADAADRASEMTERLNERKIKESCNTARSIPKGKPGDCDLCGEWSGRLVTGVCAPCRDRRRRP